MFLLNWKQRDLRKLKYLLIESRKLFESKIDAHYTDFFAVLLLLNRDTRNLVGKFLKIFKGNLSSDDAMILGYSFF